MKNCLKYCDLSLRTIVLLCALAAALLLGVALVGQYGFSLHPCDLCIYQRIPYAAIIAIGGLGGFFIKSRRLLLMVGIVCALLFLVDFGIAGYHSGVELGWFPGPTACSSDSTGGKTLEQMRAEIMGAPLVSCAQAMIYVWGLSMASWNMVAAMGCFLLSSLLLVRNRFYGK